MAKIKEIRVKYDLDNEDDRIIYEKLTMNTSQPGRVVKSIVKENIDNDLSRPVKVDSTDIDYTKELLDVIKGLSNKIDNLKVAEVKDDIEDKKDIDDYVSKSSIDFTDTDDIDF